MAGINIYHVFNSEQADFDEQGKQKSAQLQSLVDEKVNDEHLEAESIIEGYAGRPEIIFSDKDDRAYYAPVADLISVPDRKYFTSSSAFYRVIYHELGHNAASIIMPHGLDKVLISTLYRCDHAA